ncbi:hypothetical protein S83_026564 [Arachis hypogaea]|nr:uncharacterized protein DS421_8g246050 [Arachis hypogaea]
MSSRGREEVAPPSLEGNLAALVLPTPSLSSPLELREAIIAVITIHGFPRCLWVVTSSTFVVVSSSAPLNVVAFELHSITGSLPPWFGPISN